MHFLKLSDKSNVNHVASNSQRVLSWFALIGIVNKLVCNVNKFYRCKKENNENNSYIKTAKFLLRNQPEDKI